ncbi:ArsR family transcriptional regulator [Kribbella antibiotica]|uniref:ArsR family transcriptional regulator n=1 Tax=Kribbella antibiotica TaxID=190195 RepID=A0A4R4YYV2_9ACTN|nr:winged helix-turn-helix domain-containing protein [Kribbella antibiotica]TDD50606.1 ArsR family transcriptional regulator [Kribbella antibiotica]
MIRIHFSAADLGRVAFPAEPAAELLEDTPAEVFREELDERFPRAIDPYLHGLRTGRASARRALGTAVLDFHGNVLARSSDELSRRYAGDLAQRAHILMHGGTEALFTNLHPDVDWTAPTLTVHNLRADQSLDVHLRGRGLQLYPSPLISECLVDDDPRRRPILIYPCADGPAAEPQDPDTDTLAALLGRTRAAVLRSLITPASTTQLSRRVRISLASASEHTRILRAAALITTHRSQGTSLHSLTPTAHTLLTQNS